jgi:rhodanese-related sulfurtransferase
MSVVAERTVDDLLAEARSRITRYTPEEARTSGVVLVDLRSDDERSRDGIIPGSIHVPRSVLEWRCDPASGWSNPKIADRTLPIALVCAHGYSSSLAAAALAELGFERVGDLIGGFEAWREATLPVAAAPPPDDALPGMGGPQ